MKNFSNRFVLGVVFIITQLYFQAIGQVRKDTLSITSPLNIPLYLAGNYGEIRANHFHSGIDIKTDQVEGKEVLAADSGYVFRIAVQSGGYGHALYLRHPGGRVTVYGHLSQFEPSIEAWVRDQQYRNKSFEVDLSVDPDRFVFRRGDLIAYSGNTGSSGGPHLHFEIRDKSASVPFNALKYGLPLKDGIKPKINWLSVYPLDDSSTVNGLNQKLTFHVSGTNRNYYVRPDIDVSGRIGFGIETFDYLDGSSNPCSPYAISLYEDDLLLFNFVLDSIPFSLSGSVISHSDYEERIRTGKTIQKLFIDPNNRLPIYKVAVNRGIIRFSDSLSHKMTVLVADANNNTSQLNFNVRSAPVRTPNLSYDSNIVAYFRYDSLNVFETQDIKVIIPPDALYTNINFRFSKEASDSMKISDIYNIDQVYTPVKASYILSLRPRHLAENLQSKAMLASGNPKGIWSGQGGSYRNGYVTARVKTFGSFFIAVDTLNPVIIPVNFVPRKKYNPQQTITFRIIDKQSGIRKYSGYIDKNWALFEYDGKNELLSYTMDENRLEKGKMHKVEIIVIDNMENITHFLDDFYF